MQSLAGLADEPGYDTHVADCVVFPAEVSSSGRISVLGASILVGAAGALVVLQGGAAPVVPLLLATAFAGGVLSTWSPCGYSSISLLRPSGRGAVAAAGWLPVFLVHGAGYLLGAVVLGFILGAIGLALGFSGVATGFALSILAALGLCYGAHQLDLLKMPYPQRRAQVPHDARNRFSKWVVSALYGFSLGLDYITYVQTPLLYLTTVAAILSGKIGTAILLIAVFNLGRYLPVAVNLMPWRDYQIQAWLARHQKRAALADGAILAATGAAFLIFAIAG